MFTNYSLKFCPIRYTSDYFCSFQSVSIHFGPIQSIWSTSIHFGPFSLFYPLWSSLVHFGTFVPFWFILVYFSSFDLLRSIWFIFVITTQIIMIFFEEVLKMIHSERFTDKKCGCVKNLVRQKTFYEEHRKICSFSKIFLWKVFEQIFERRLKMVFAI